MASAGYGTRLHGPYNRTQREAAIEIRSSDEGKCINAGMSERLRWLVVPPVGCSEIALVYPRRIHGEPDRFTPRAGGLKQE